MGDQEIRLPIRFEGVPELVILSARNPEDAADLLASQGRRGCLCAGHSPLHALPPRESAELDMTGLGGRLGCRDRGGRPGKAQSPDRLATIDLGCHGRHPSWTVRFRPGLLGSLLGP